MEPYMETAVASAELLTGKQPKLAIRPAEVANRLSISVASVWRKVDRDPKFPKPFKLGEGTRATFFDPEELEGFVAECKRASEK
jgi:predicted DNA-binding transcriptional regulator AlpA